MNPSPPPKTPAALQCPSSPTTGLDIHWYIFSSPRFALAGLLLGGSGFGGRTLVLAHGGGYLGWSGVKIAGAGQEGNSSIAISPTGSTHRLPAMRVTNDRVAASRARLTYG